MIEMTVQMPDSLAARIRGFGVWLPQILELSLLNFATPARVSVSELIAFLEHNPNPQEILHYAASARQQRHLGRLLALNKEGLLSAAENRELDELEQLESFVIRLKAKVAQEHKLKL